MELITKHQLFYSNKEFIPLSEIAESLLALEKLIKQSPSTIESFFPGLKIYQIEVYLNELQSGSLWEDIVIKFIFGNQEKFDEVISNSREKLGIKYLADHPKLLSAILLALLLTGGHKALKANPETIPQHLQTIEITNNIVINTGAELSEMKPEEFKRIITDSVNKNASFTKNAIKIVKPAKREKNASITFDDTPSLTIPPEAVLAMPGFVDNETPAETIQEFNEVEVLIRATDLDHKRTGWGAVIPSISDKRTRLQLAPSINPETLTQKRNFTGDVTVVFKYNDEGMKIPKFYFLRSIQ